MTGRRPSAPEEYTLPKKQRKTISVGVKLDVSEHLERGDRLTDVGRKLAIPFSTIQTILVNTEQIKKSTQPGTPASVTMTPAERSHIILEKMEKMLRTWIEDKNQQNVPVSMGMVKAKARALFEELQENEEYTLKILNVSSNWFTKFMGKYGYDNIEVTGEAASTDTITPETFVDTLRAIVDKGCYSAKQIFNMKETELFWKRLPSRTFISQEEQSTRGYKVSKDRFTLLLGGNAEGDCKLKPVMVYHSTNPRALNGYIKKLLPVHFYSNAKGCMTGSLFCEYFVSELQSELRQYCEREKLDYKILLIVDNAPGHPPTIQDLCDNIKVVYIPPNMASVIQPMNQGVIIIFKTYYLKKALDALIKATDDNKMTVGEFWRRFNIRHSIRLVGEAWEEITSSCMNDAWKKLFPDFVPDFTGFSIENDLSKARESIVTLAKTAGFGEVELNHVVELLDSHTQELSAEDLLELERVRREEEGIGEDAEVRKFTRKGLSEALLSIEESLAMLEENDPNSARSARVSRNVLAALQCYADILNEMKMRQKCPC